MTRNAIPRIVLLSVVGIILIANAVIFGGRLFSWVADSTGAVIAPFSGRVAWLRAMVSVVAGQKDLAARVVELEEENGRLRGEASELEELRRETSFYREASGIVTGPAGVLMEAAVFSYNISGGVRQVVVNKGTDDGVAVGHVVMTVRGELLGTVQTVFARHAIVWRVQDRSFQVTARVAGSEITGLVRSDGSGSMLLDLVQKDEHIAEHARIVTSGDDSYPAGLIIGTVRSVDNNAATLFQIVHIEPAVPDIVRGPVLIVLP